MEQSDTISYSCEVRQLPSHLSDIKSLFSREIKLKKFGRITVKGNGERWGGYKLKTRKLSTNLPIVQQAFAPSPHTLLSRSWQPGLQCSSSLGIRSEDSSLEPVNEPTKRSQVRTLEDPLMKRRTSQFDLPVGKPTNCHN